MFLGRCSAMLASMIYWYYGTFASVRDFQIHAVCQLNVLWTVIGNVGLDDLLGYLQRLNGSHRIGRVMCVIKRVHIVIHIHSEYRYRYVGNDLNRLHVSDDRQVKRSMPKGLVAGLISTEIGSFYSMFLVSTRLNSRSIVEISGVTALNAVTSVMSPFSCSGYAPGPNLNTCRDCRFTASGRLHAGEIGPWCWII